MMQNNLLEAFLGYISIILEYPGQLRCYHLNTATKTKWKIWFTWTVWLVCWNETDGLCCQLQACVDQSDVRWGSSTYNRRLNVRKRNTSLSVLTVHLIEKPLELPLSPCTCPAFRLLPGFDSPSVNNSITHHCSHCTCTLYGAAAAPSCTPLPPHASPARCKIPCANVRWGRLVAHFCMTAHLWTYLLLCREIL